MLPRVCAESPIQRLRELIDLPCAKMRVPTCLPATISASTPGLWPLAMMTFSPAVDTRRAASSLLDMPPLPGPPSWSSTSAMMESLTSWTVVIVRNSDPEGSASYKPSTSDKITSSASCNKLVTSAAKRSLSPNVTISSSTATVSFSLMIGITPHSNSDNSVLRTLRYRPRSFKSSPVNNTCAACRPCSRNVRS